jgi:hypothetical protein
MNNGFEPPWKNFEQSVDTHLGILQSMIQRMASNSAAAKTWAVGLTTAALFYGTNRDIEQIQWISLLPAVSLLLLDVYYLSLEKAIRFRYTEFIRSMNSESFSVELFFDVSPPPTTAGDFIRSLKSPSILIFYVPLILLCSAVSLWVG